MQNPKGDQDRGADALREALRVVDIETRAMHRAVERLGDEFEAAVRLLFDCRGRIVVCGSGKSGLVGRKIASTFASTGSPALFLHPADGGHGDLGVVVRGDVALLISYSGENEELIRILPGLKKIGIPIVALCGHSASTLSRSADVSIDISVEEEACPNGLAPTASTAVTMGLGDALAIVLLKRRGFRTEDFALLHPGGSIGRRLLTRVSDVMHREDDAARVRGGSTMQQALVEMTAKGLGAVCVVDERGRLIGLLTDGDLRRSLE
ncbi:MAG: KpsF/GutQ family sugar-phosphate isomerase, partial [Myxococcales bacterium]|nr:KpsF/GutQ family sugar-phosphate isomerase [Myxococcales bacterium]